MNEWTKTFPGSGAADNLRGRIDRWLGQLERGEIRAASDALRGDRWRYRLDLTGMPKEVLGDLDRLFNAAWLALRDPEDTEAARTALRDARDRVTL